MFAYKTTPVSYG